MSSDSEQTGLFGNGNTVKWSCCTYFGGFFLELLDGTLVDTATFVDHMSGGGGLARIDVTDDDDADARLGGWHDWI